jgi:EAL domain-containing protein (putative c-di-GMP-specific phosphodiesterase class I)
MPDDFVPVAERSGLIVGLDMWMLRMVALQLAAWSKVPSLAHVPVSVNVSGRTLLQSSFVADVSDALERHAVDAHRLTVEVTETALVTDLRLAATQLERLRALGVRISIDDFGTGYTSIAHLRAMPVDELKIDSSFIHRLPDPGDRVLIQMIKDVAELLGLSTVAEGVENRTQIEILTAIGCDALQGYYFSEPVDAGAIARWAAAAQALTPGTAP